MKKLILFYVLFIIISCSEKKPVNSLPDYQQPVITKTPEPTVDEYGSLWGGDKSVDSFFLDVKANKVGDLLTVIVQEETTASNRAATDLDRQAEVDNSITSLGGMAQLLNKIPGGVGKYATLGMGGASKNTFNGGGSTSRSDNLESRISVQVIELLATGNFKISGRRELKVNNETQIMELQGVVRPQDVRIDNTVLSSFIADARINYTGSGVISDKQRPGWFARVLDWIWPF